MPGKLLKISALGLAVVLAASCSVKKTASHKQPQRGVVQVAQFKKGDLSYEIYRQPLAGENMQATAKGKQNTIRLSIRIINKAGNVSPLRAVSANYEKYNINNEYLLNGAKNDIMLLVKGLVIYPSYYSFENNYNAFPFETINLGYSLTTQQRKLPVELIFVDKVFTQDSILFNLNFK